MHTAKELLLERKLEIIGETLPLSTSPAGVTEILQDLDSIKVLLQELEQDLTSQTTAEEQKAYVENVSALGRRLALFRQTASTKLITLTAEEEQRQLALKAEELALKSKEEQRQDQRQLTLKTKEEQRQLALKIEEQQREDERQLALKNQEDERQLALKNQEDQRQLALRAEELALKTQDDERQLALKLQNQQRQDEKVKQEIYQEAKTKWNYISSTVASQFANLSQITDSGEAEVYLQQFQPYCQEIEILAPRLLNPQFVEDINQVQTSITETSEKLRRILVHFGKILSTRTQNTDSCYGSTLNGNGKANAHLPTIQIPHFDGHLGSWLTFRDMFVSMVCENHSLNAVQKLHYLKSSLKGSAFELIKNIPTTEANFETSWKMVEERYSNERDLVSTYVKRLLDLPQVKTEDATSLRKLCDSTKEILRALEILNRKEKLATDIITYLVTQRLDENSRRDWNLTLQDSSPPELDPLLQFIDRKARALASSQDNNKGHVPTVKTDSRFKKTQRKSLVTHQVTNQQTPQKCSYCHQPKHSLLQCEKFKAQTPFERKAWTLNNKRCLNCLQIHPEVNCPKKPACWTCKLNHNSLLHMDATPSTSQLNPTAPTFSHGVHSTVILPTRPYQTNVGKKAKKRTSAKVGVEQTASCETNQTAGQGITLLHTAQIILLDNWGEKHQFRALIDNGSMVTLISERAAQTLRLPRMKSSVEITGVSSHASTKTRGCVQLEIRSAHIPEFELQTEALIMPKFSQMLPQQQVDSSTWNHIKSLPLADETFDVPAKIDVILGADVFSEVTIPNRVYGMTGTPIAFYTVFGYVIGGKTSDYLTTAPSNYNTMQTYLTFTSLSKTVEKLWELEKVPETSDKTFRTLTEEEAEKDFKLNCSRLPDGRYQVKIPFKSTPALLGESRYGAAKVFASVEKRFKANQELKDQYSHFMNEYTELGHMGKSYWHPTTEDPDHYFLPHHPVYKQSSLTTRLRVVFDGSKKTSSGHSLNDLQLIGYKVQPDLFDILIGFRMHPFAINCDVIKMFRNVTIHPEHRKYQQILWRNEETMPIETHTLNTVTYGLASSAFLATRVLRQLADDEGDKFPAAKAAILESTYMDDILSGASSLSDARDLCRQLIALFSAGGFYLNKWSSNSAEVLDVIQTPDTIVQSPKNLDPDATLNILGLSWLPSTDAFVVQPSTPDQVVKLTKRILLSQMAKIFDPLGFLTPVTLWSKLQIQKLWKDNIQWDDAVTSQVAIEWKEFNEQLHDLQTITIPRFVGIPSDPDFQLFGFSDASIKAYCATVYVRANINGCMTSQLLTAKSKVAPLKQMTVPRLELCGALLLTKLISKVQSILKVPVTKINCFTDSMIVLTWINSTPQQFNAFVANRVVIIRELLPSIVWKFITTHDNPADLGTRGLTPRQLIRNPQWWTGPQFILETNTPTETPQQLDISSIPELREIPSSLRVVAQLTVVNPAFDLGLPARFSSWTKVVRVTAYILRFVSNATPCGPRFSGVISTIEYKRAVNYQLKAVQREFYGEEVKTLSANRPITGGKLSPLDPYLDPEDLRALTPAHFLGTYPASLIASPDLTVLQGNLKSNFDLIQRETQIFWKRWSSEYLHHLQPRKKWRQRAPNMKIGDMLVLRDKNMPPAKWKLGRICAVHPGRDGLARVVSIKTQDGVTKRAIKDVVLLPS